MPLDLGRVFQVKAFGTDDIISLICNIFIDYLFSAHLVVNVLIFDIGSE